MHEWRITYFDMATSQIEEANVTGDQLIFEAAGKTARVMVRNGDQHVCKYVFTEVNTVTLTK